ncbi:unknown [Acinetobacter sp. CAG:196]|nr:unknown [Acinetobacter sp. CAG:196]
MLNMSGNLMQGIENSGFLGSFLIQDFCGMTIPRTAAGFLRDKEHTGHYNMQEGKEVFGREGLTGPCMMAVAPLSLLIAAKFGRTTSVNTQLIKRFGNSLKEILTNPNFDKGLLKQPERFKQEFYRTNIEKILNDTLGKENTQKESVEYILKQINNMEKIPADAKLKKFRGKAKYRSECMNNIMEHIDNIRYSTSSDLNMLQKVKFGSDKLDCKKAFSTKNTIDAMIKYSDDAIILNRHLDKLDELSAESIKNKSLAKRMITNISMMAATLGVLSVLPKIYARSNTAPGARKVDQKTQDYNIAFEGRKPDTGVLEKLGKVINKNKNDFVSNELEYNGHNFTNTLMAGLSVFGLLAPRGLRAYSRAQVDEDGKKDLTELWEIVLRDLTSSLAVVFAVPMLTRACVTSYEKKSGFVLMQKDRSSQSKLKTSLDLLNPYSKAHVLTNSEINSLYNNIDTKDKMLNFCKYIDKNGGDLQKIISKSEHAEEIFKISSLNGLNKADKNKKIISLVEKFDKSKADEIIKKLMKAVGKAKSNKITTFARGLTSVPGLLTTFFISPYLLGWFIPRLTYKNTRRIHEKQDREREARRLEKLNSINN